MTGLVISYISLALIMSCRYLLLKRLIEKEKRLTKKISFLNQLLWFAARGGPASYEIISFYTLKFVREKAGWPSESKQKFINDHHGKKDLPATLNLILDDFFENLTSWEKKTLEKEDSVIFSPDYAKLFAEAAQKADHMINLDRRCQFVKGEAFMINWRKTP